VANWAATSAGEIHMSAKPDPEMQEIVVEVAECSRRVMTPPPGSTGRSSP